MGLQREPPPDDGSERLSTLLVEQLEHADLVLLNKADIASEEELQQARALTYGLNASAEVRIIAHGRVEPDVLWSTSAFTLSGDASHSEDCHGHDHAHHQAHAHVHSHGHAHGHDESCADVRCTDPSHDHRSSADKRFGIKSFVYRTQKPLSKQRLVKALKSWSKARAGLGSKLELTGMQAPTVIDETVEPTPLLPILRSKGIVCIDGTPPIPYNWSHAGKSMSLSMWMPSTATWDGIVPSTEVVFIGAGHDEAAIRALLDSCLLTSDELAP